MKLEEMNRLIIIGSDWVNRRNCCKHLRVFFYIKEKSCKKASIDIKKVKISIDKFDLLGYNSDIMDLLCNPERKTRLRSVER